MWSIIENIFSPTQYMPHGSCYLWQTPLIWLHVLSHFFIAIAYYSIPAMLIYFVHKRDNLPFSKVFILFSAFIIACGTGHLLDIWTLWHPAYWLSGVERALTALISCYTALEMSKLLPQFLALRSPEELEIINQKLQLEIHERQETEKTLKSILQGTGSVTGGEFFPALVKNLAVSLKVQYVFLAEVIDKTKEKLKTIAFCQGDELLEDFEYTLEHSPCQQVVRDGISVCYSDEIQKKFSQNQGLVDLKAVSYLGVPLLNNSKEIIGTLCVIDTKPRTTKENAIAIMQVFAARASAEIERKNAVDNLSEAYEKLEDKVHNRTAELEATLSSLQQEIRKRKKIEKALKTEQKQLRQIINKAPVAIAMLNKDMVYLAHSQKWVADYDLKNKNLVGSFFYDTFPHLPEKWLDIHRRVLEGESLSQNEDIIEYNGQTFYLRWAFQPWFTHENEVGGLIIVTQNIEDLVKAREMAIETTQLKSSFLANMSHEIRTPMSGILGIVEILKRTNLSEEQRQFVQTLTHSSRHLLFIINDILDFSKLEAKEMELENREFSLYNCLESVLDLLFNQAETKDLKLFNLIEDNVPSLVVGDNNRLRQILLNLAGNAIKFTQKGQVTIQVSFDSQSDNTIKLKFKVVDTGLGIAKKDQQKLFNSFTQVDATTTREYGGTGLGLAICKRLVELMGGEIGVESKLNKGSTFWFTINFIKSNQENFFKHKIEENLSGSKILLIGNYLSSEVITQQFQYWGISSEQNANCLEAILKLQRESSQENSFDFVLTNWDNKQENEQLMYQVILTHPLLKNANHILVISPQNYNNKLSSWLKEHKINYLLKPLHLSQLIELMLNKFAHIEESLFEQKNLTTSTVNSSKINPLEYPLKILLVEDTYINQAVITKLLDTLGYQDVTCVDNGKIALEKLEQEDYDLIFMDCLMPILDGYETTKIIRKQKTNKKHIIIAMTANAFDGEKERCLEIGMDDYISKPIEIDVLENLLSQWAKKIHTVEDSQQGISHQKNPSDDVSHKFSDLLKKNLIDQKQLDLMFGNDWKLKQEVLTMYTEDASAYLDDLKQAYNKRDFEDIYRYAHRLKGASYSVAIKLIPDWLSEIEMLAKKSVFEGVDTLINKIDITLEKLTIFQK